MNEFSWPVRVYYEDTDAAGLVYYANYPKFMERARTEWLRALGFEQTFLRDEYGIVFAVSKMEIEFLKPARFNDSLSVTVEVDRAGRVSIDLLQRVFRGPEELVCRADVRIACVEADTMRPCGMPAAVLTELERVT
ncbi:MAG: tol-pal system-associated acyl-CoA thioesterase [Gammaproteobacteria bacterium]|nr:tol-pal system-associated acyl-CoA thioesterase [Gammaproteobacteria bacterium]